MTREIQQAIIRGAARFILRQLAPLQKRLDDIERRELIPGPRGEPGPKGDTGERGADGLPGRDGADGLNGKDGAPGRDGVDGINGKDGAPGERGRDGVDGKGVTIDEVMSGLEGLVAKWALEFERRAQDMLQRAVDRLPVPKDGLDGLGFDDLDVVHDGTGGIILRFARGEQKKEFALQLPTLVDRGVFKEGSDYKMGNGVTFGGCFWIAQKDNPEGKPGSSDDWRLAVKKGRDGRDAGDK